MLLAMSKYTSLASVTGCARIDESGQIYVDGAFIANSAYNNIATFAIPENWQSMAISSTNTVEGKYIIASAQPDTFTNRYQSKNCKQVTINCYQ